MQKLYVEARTRLASLFKKLAQKEDGISSVEYALLLALITAAIAAAATGLGTAVTGAITNATSQITGS